MMQPIPISIVVSDPWDLGVATNWAPLRGTIIEMKVSQKGGQALVRFEKPIEYRGAAYSFAVASPRLDGQDIESIVAGTSICASLIGISRDQAESIEPFDTSAWRGGLGFIGDIMRMA